MNCGQAESALRILRDPDARDDCEQNFRCIHVFGPGACARLQLLTILQNGPCSEVGRFDMTRQGVGKSGVPIHVAGVIARKLRAKRHRSIAHENGERKHLGDTSQPSTRWLR